jgi:uncharacterized protein YdaU (DUF1376 family)
MKFKTPKQKQYQRQWMDGHIPDDLHLLARLCRLDESEMAQVWRTLSEFFPVVEPGKRANRYMWIEREAVIAELARKSDQFTQLARKRWNAARDASGNANANATGSADGNALGRRRIPR